MTEGKFFTPYRGGLWGVSKPENPEEDWDKPENPDDLKFNNFFKNSTHWYPLGGLNPKTRTVLLQDPKPELEKWQNLSPVKYTWPENPRDFLKKPENPMAKSAKPATRETPKPPSL